jgi:hypothetical protein
VDIGLTLGPARRRRAARRPGRASSGRRLSSLERFDAAMDDAWAGLLVDD